MLAEFDSAYTLVAGCDEAGRGCLAGPVFAAAVILPPGFSHELLNDSKKLSPESRMEAREVILNNSISWGVGSCDITEIDDLNILWASVKAMHKALDLLERVPEHIIVDGNRFSTYRSVSHQCIVKGDATYTAIAAASILAKSFRDDHMLELASQYPGYGWERNKGYGTREHIRALSEYGKTPHHRNSFKPVSQLSILFEGT